MSRTDKELIQQKIRILRKLGKIKRKLPTFSLPTGIINQEREYKRDLKKILNSLFAITKEKLISQLERIERQSKREVPLVNKDAYGDEIDDAIAAIRLEFGRQWTKEELKALAKRRGESLSKVNKLNNERNWKRVMGIDIATSEPWLPEYIEAFALNNAMLITSVETKYIDEISQIVYRGFQTGIRASTIADQILERVNVSESRAELIARDQINKLNGTLTEVRQTELGITRYIWQTVGDERVRESHRELDGTTQEWSDPPTVDGEAAHPGQPINCRCSASPLLEDLIE